jgi:hypothetical protein
MQSVALHWQMGQLGQRQGKNLNSFVFLFDFNKNKKN